MKEYTFSFSGRLYVAYYEIASSIEMLEKRINEIISCKRLFSSYASRKELLNNLAGQRNRMIIEGILAGSIHEVQPVVLRKAA